MKTSPKSSPSRLWTRDSSVLLGAFVLVALLVVYFWWPLAAAMLRRIDWNGQWWLQMDWLLIGIFTFMSLTIVARANLKTDLLIIFVATCGGLVIEAWGTQTNLWTYYTSERPPLWIIPAWPIATLSIDRIMRIMNLTITKIAKDRNTNGIFKTLYWTIFIAFMIIMIVFVAPTISAPFTIISLLLCTIIMFTPTDYRRATLIFIAGAALGYYLELWGTTRRCWTYYSLETPPLFAVLAHGMAAIAFWRAGLVIKIIGKKIGAIISNHAKLRTKPSELSSS